MLNVTLYQDAEGNDKFQVHETYTEEETGEQRTKDVTEAFEVFAVEIEGLPAWAVARKGQSDGE